MPIGLFSGILIECTTWTTKNVAAKKWEQSESNLPHAQEKWVCVCVVWNDCLFFFDFSQKICFLWFRFLCHINLHFFLSIYCSFSLTLTPSFLVFFSFAPHFTLLFHHINIFQSQHTHSHKTLTHRKRERECMTLTIMLFVGI